MDINEILDGFQSLKVLVIGDVMLDTYLRGEVSRISPEAPVPVVLVKKKENRLGGAANVAYNVKKLGAEPILISIIGDDQRGSTLIDLLEQNEINPHNLIQSGLTTTTSKSRVSSRNHQLIRFDEENVDFLNESLQQEFIDKIFGAIDQEKPSILIFQDYDKGVLNKTIISSVIDKCHEHNIPIAVDPKKNNFIHYNGITLFKPNLREVQEGLNIQIENGDLNSIQSAADTLAKEIQSDIYLITLSEKGILLKANGSDHLVESITQEVSDVSGAGDTVISVAALC
ncbi:MAG: D-glycero-beta-D-manno-heptose-7-phosphate kinase, partial [Bacteroidetes bacterium]|nr:D-glycero-beta-D-manno-heptose-7-phosphate kinase [Bacteroidota bacterium]